MSTNWAYRFCRDCGVRLASPGEFLCDRCEYDWDVKAAKIEADNAK